VFALYRSSPLAVVGGGFGSSFFVFVGFAFGLFCVAGAAVCGVWVRGGEGLLQFSGSDG